MAGTLRLSNTGTGNGQSTITTAASGDTTYTLPSGGGTFVTTGSTQALTVAFASGTVSAPSITFLGDSNTGIYSPAADTIAFTEGGVEALRIDSSGRVGVGTNTPNATLTLASASSTVALSLMDAAYNVYPAVFSANNATGEIKLGGVNTAGTYYLTLYTQNTERARIDTSGRLLVGTSSASTAGTSKLLQVVDAGGGAIGLGRTSASSIASGEFLGGIDFLGAGLTPSAHVWCYADAAQGSTTDLPSRLVFSTTADGASSPTERMRITSVGDCRFGTTNSNPVTNNVSGVIIGADASGSLVGYVGVSRMGGPPMGINRGTDDGNLIEFCQAGTQEGTISVSGTTVSYNGAHLSRWSQLSSGVERTEILRGSVLSNIDEMCEWGEEDNEQLNRMKVSDIEGDKNVSGVFQAWDDDDDTYTNDFYCAMTGDFIIRIGAGVTVERGDLLMSAGDGTAKPQDDDIIRSKTVAKVTSTNVSCTYGDGSYCVPCVLMAC